MANAQQKYHHFQIINLTLYAFFFHVRIAQQRWTVQENRAIAGYEHLYSFCCRSGRGSIFRLSSKNAMFRIEIEFLHVNIVIGWAQQIKKRRFSGALSTDTSYHKEIIICFGQIAEILNKPTILVVNSGCERIKY